MTWIEQVAQQQIDALSRELEAPILALAGACGLLWDNWARLDRILAQGLDFLPHAQLVYVVDLDGRQVSANIAKEGLDESKRGQNLADRPYLTAAVPWKSFLISEVYVSQSTGRPCVTAVQTVEVNGQVRGFLAADFDLRDLPLPEPAGSGRGRSRRSKSAARKPRTWPLTSTVCTAVTQGRPVDWLTYTSEIRKLFHGTAAVR